MRIWRSLVFVLLCATSVAAQDLSNNPAGVPWLNTNDEWGRAWGDAANQFYKNLEAHRNVHGGDQMQFAVGTEIALRKVFRPKVWFKGNFSGSVSIMAARGEYEAFQLVICPITDEERGLGYLSDGRAQGNGSLVPKTVVIHAIDVSPLHHADVDYQIESAASTLYRVGYIPTQPGQYPVMHVGDWPDPLLPLGPLEVSNPYCQPVWVEIRVPREAPAGEYSGHVTVHGPHDVRIEIELTVWDFTLPNPPRTVSNGWVLHEWFRRDGTDRLLERLDVLLDHRLIAWHTAVDTRGDLEAHDRVMELLLSRGVQLQAIGGKPDAAYIEHLHSRGWLEHFVSLWGDEPHERDYPRYREQSDVIHNEFPGLAVAMTEEPTPTNVGLFDVWIAEPSAQRDAWVQDALNRGDRVWWYLCQLPINAEYPGPIHRAPGMVVDRPAIDHRITYWLAFEQHIDGVSYWAVSQWPEGWDKWNGGAEPWPTNPRVPFPYSGQHNANGFLCYPGSDGMPWPSIRLKTMRDGLEDHDYLSLLRERAGDTLWSAIEDQAVPHELAVGLRYYNKDPHVLLKVRRQVAERIIQLPQANPDRHYLSAD